MNLKLRSIVLVVQVLVSQLVGLGVFALNSSKAGQAFANMGSIIISSLVAGIVGGYLLKRQITFREWLPNAAAYALIGKAFMLVISVRSWTLLAVILMLAIYTPLSALFLRLGCSSVKTFENTPASVDPENVE